MARSSARSGGGSKLQIGDGAGPEVFTDLGEVRDINGPDRTKDTDDATHMQSDNGYSESISTLLHGGSVTADLNFNPGSTTYATLVTAMEDPDPTNFRLVLPAATAKRFAFAAHVTALGSVQPFAGRMSLSVTLQITGKPVFEATA